MRPRAILLVVGGAALVAAASLAYTLLPRPIHQPIAFNHNLHIETVGADCTDCHLHAKTGARATIANIEVCGGCHAEAQSESREEARVVDHVKAGRPIRWLKVNRVPEHVYFSHRRHTAIGGIDCEACHGKMSDRRLPVDRPAVRLTMSFCMRCHETTGASNDCLLCHR